MGLFLAHHWLLSRRPSRRQAQASPRPACHFLTLCGGPPGPRRGWWAQREDKAHQLSNEKSTQLPARPRPGPSPLGHASGYQGSPGEAAFNTPPRDDWAPGLSTLQHPPTPGGLLVPLERQTTKAFSDLLKVTHGVNLKPSERPGWTKTLGCQVRPRRQSRG